MNHLLFVSIDSQAVSSSSAHLSSSKSIKFGAFAGARLLADDASRRRSLFDLNC